MGGKALRRYFPFRLLQPLPHTAQLPQEQVTGHQNHIACSWEGAVAGCRLISPRTTTAGAGLQSQGPGTQLGSAGISGTRCKALRRQQKDSAGRNI